MSFGKSTILLGLAMLAGCSSASGPTYTVYSITSPDGEPTYRVTCYGLLDGPGTCHKQAEEICKTQPVKVLAGESRLNGTADGKPDDRNITFQCGEHAPVATVVPEPAPATPVAMPTKVLSLSGDANFDTAKATLTPAARARLDALLEQERGVRIVTLTVKGYTDSVGSDAYNQNLSDRRAQAVADYLATHGLVAQRVVSRGYGKADPIDSNATAAGRAKNRRVDVLMERDQS